MSEAQPIVCLSHLAWDETLFQRPQQIMSRMAERGHDVLYLSRISSKQWIRSRNSKHSGGEGALEWRNLPHVPLRNTLRLGAQMEDRHTARTVRRWLHGRENAVLWLYHPSGVRVADHIPHATLVYDVMDHFPGFRRSRGDVGTLEDELLARANVVFSGGGALQESVVQRRPDARCYPSGVQLEHFAKACEPSTEEPHDLRGLPRPILGFFGALDERLDFNLVRSLCRLRRDASFVFLGPLIPGTLLGVDEPNFRWLGPKPYADLPNYLRHFDVCLMPWVQTALTAHISPTKTPEYLAGGKPVVSVPIPDVQRDYGDVVFFGDDTESFSKAIDQALAARDRDWSATLINRPAARTWDQIVEEMTALLP